MRHPPGSWSPFFPALATIESPIIHVVIDSEKSKRKKHSSNEHILFDAVFSTCLFVCLFVLLVNPIGTFLFDESVILSAFHMLYTYGRTD